MNYRVWLGTLSLSNILFGAFAVLGYILDDYFIPIHLTLALLFVLMYISIDKLKELLEARK